MIGDWRLQIIRVVLESIVMVPVGTVLVRDKLAWKQIILAGTIIGLLGFALQQAPVKYGIHIPLGIIVFTLTLHLAFKIHIFKSAVAALLSFITVILAEGLTVVIQLNLLGYTKEQLLSGSEFARFVISLPPFLIVAIIAFILQMKPYRKGDEGLR